MTERPRTHAERLRATDGYFQPESVIRRVGNTPVTPFLGGGAAVLLQVAHPLVAEGVAQHSDYEHDLWRRLARTLRALYLVTFGTREEAERAGIAVQTVHRHVNGTTDARLGRFPAGTHYSACDPELMLWVHATLVQTSLSAYQLFERALSGAEQESYYRDMATVAELFGVPAPVLPPTLDDFRTYFDEQIRGDSVIVTPVARRIAAVIMRAPLPIPLRLFTPAHRLATPAQLPQRLRQEYGFRWTPLHRLALPAAGWSLSAHSDPGTARRLPLATTQNGHGRLTTSGAAEAVDSSAKCVRVRVGPILCVTFMTLCRRSTRTNTFSIHHSCASSSTLCGGTSIDAASPEQACALIEPLFVELLADRAGCRSATGSPRPRVGWVAGSGSGCSSGPPIGRSRCSASSCRRAP